MRILFVCLGNICRSPAAEGVMRAMAPNLEIDSAGTGAWHAGEPPHGPMREAARARGYELGGLRARQVSARDFERFDMILAMDRQNLADLRAIGGEAPGLGLFLDHAPGAGTREVPDPYYTGDYEAALDLVELGCRGLARAIQAQ